MSSFRKCLKKLNKSFSKTNMKLWFLKLPSEILLEIFKLIPSNEIINYWSKHLCLNRLLSHTIGYTILNFEKIFLNKSKYNYHMEHKDLFKFLILNYTDTISKSTETYFKVLKFFKKRNLNFPSTVKTLAFCYNLETFKREEYEVFYNTIRILYQLDKCYLTINLNSEHWTMVVNLNTEYPLSKDFKSLYCYFNHKQLLVPNLNGISAKSLAMKGELYGCFETYPINLTQLVIDSENKITISLNNLPITLKMIIIKSPINLLDCGRFLPHLKICAILINDPKINKFIHSFIRRHFKLTEFLSIRNFTLTKADVINLKRLVGLFLYECQNLPFEHFYHIKTLKTLKINNCETYGIQNINLPFGIEILQVEPEDMAYPLSRIRLPETLKYING